MSFMIEEFNRFIKHNDLFRPADKILLAVSGGMDSSVLAELFHLSGYEFVIAHCNFALRGKESDGDMEFVNSMAEKNNVAFYCTTFKTGEFAKKNGLSIQMAARELRYQWFNKILSETGCKFVATAHHLDDQVETFLINLTRVTGITGLQGIRPKMGNVVRPLLFATRKEIESFATQNEIAYREDSSNKSDNYTRNFIRHQIIPQFEKINPEFKNILTQSIENLRNSAEIYNKHLEEIKQNITVEDVDHTIKHELTSTDELLDSIPEIEGLKTGWTPEAGGCFIGLINLNGHYLISVVAQSTDRFADTKSLIDWAKNNVFWQTYQP